MGLPGPVKAAGAVAGRGASFLASWGSNLAFMVLGNRIDSEFAEGALSEVSNPSCMLQMCISLCSIRLRPPVSLCLGGGHTRDSSFYFPHRVAQLPLRPEPAQSHRVTHSAPKPTATPRSQDRPPLRAAPGGTGADAEGAPLRDEGGQRGVRGVDQRGAAGDLVRAGGAEGACASGRSPFPEATFHLLFFCFASLCLKAHRPNRGEARTLYRTTRASYARFIKFPEPKHPPTLPPLNPRHPPP